ncbi:MAG: PTS sugar transporter subunit IIA [Candidatus Omnitrophica bacterium]|nr:PTS sugar transporter subunit IIA [Candidatus Omnitrophota bacterium]
MKLSSVFNKKLINLNLQARNKEEAFNELIDLVGTQHKALDKDKILRAIMERESQQSTYLGKSLALPHARIEGLDDFIIVCGRSAQGLQYDREKDSVKFVIMILSCKTKINTLLQTMGALATFFSEEGLVQQVTNATSPDEFVKAIIKSNISIKQTLVAKDIMRKNIANLSLQQTLKEVIDLFFEKNISGAPVLDTDGTVLGVVTEKEIISIGIPKYMSMMDNISFLKDFEPFEEIFKKEDEILVKDIYSKKFIFAHENVSVIQLAFSFVNKNCRRILVIDDNNKLQGLIMRKDLIRKVIHV